MELEGSARRYQKLLSGNFIKGSPTTEGLNKGHDFLRAAKGYNFLGNRCKIQYLVGRP